MLAVHRLEMGPRRRKIAFEISVDAQDRWQPHRSELADDLRHLASRHLAKRLHVLRIGIRIEWIQAVKKRQGLVEGIFRPRVKAGLRAGDSTTQIGLHRVGAGIPRRLDVPFDIR